MFTPTVANYTECFNAISEPNDEQQAAFAEFNASGLPTRGLENWKYTDVSALQATTFQRHVVRETDTQVCPLPLLSSTGQHPFLSLNHALSPNENKRLIDQDGDYHLEFDLSNNTASLSRYQIEVANNVQANLTITYRSLDDSACFENHCIDIQLHRDARLNVYRDQQLNQQSFVIDHLTVRQSANSYFYLFTLDKGAQLSRTDVTVHLNQSYAECSLNGLYLTGNKQHVDHHSVIHHHASHCTSSEFFRGLLDDQSRAVFNGKIIFPKGAERSVTRQMNNTILLSTGAEIDTKPELEIYADDVAASHGATVGALDQSALFYLQSRGMSPAEAKALLIQAFANEVFETIPNDSYKQTVINQADLGEVSWD